MREYVTHTEELTRLSPLVLLTRWLPNKQPTELQCSHPNKQQQPPGKAFPAGRGRRARLRSPLAPLPQPAGQGASSAPAALPAGRAGVFTTSYRWPGCRLQ